MGTGGTGEKNAFFTLFWLQDRFLKRIVPTVPHFFGPTIFLCDRHALPRWQDVRFKYIPTPPGNWEQEAANHRIRCGLNDMRRFR